jgi:ATP-dependent Clp protease ATP-binding subunit ClpA
MFDRFTERARRVMTLARTEAQALRNDYIGTEHVLLGLVQEGTGVAAQVLKNLDVDLKKVRAEVEGLVEQGTSPATRGQFPFTPRAKRVLELALEEAQGLGHNYIGTEHLLLGLIRENDGPAAHVLRNLGVGTEAVREEVAELLGVESHVLPGLPGMPGSASRPRLPGRRPPLSFEDFSVFLDWARRRLPPPPDVAEVEKALADRTAEMQEAVAREEYEEAAAVRRAVEDLRTRLLAALVDWKERAWKDFWDHEATRDPGEGPRAG